MTEIDRYCIKSTCYNCKLFDRCKRYERLKLSKDELIKRVKNDIIPKYIKYLDEGKNV